MLHNNKIQIEREARAWLARGEWDKAIAAYRSLLDVRGEDPMIYNLIGDAYVKMGNFDEAFQEYMRAIDLYTSEGLFENGIAICKKVLRFDKSRAEIYLRLAELYAHLEFTNEALTALKTYAEKDPSKEIVKRAVKRYTNIIKHLSKNGTATAELKKIYLEIGYRDSELDQLVGVVSDRGKTSISVEKAKHKPVKGQELSTQPISQKDKVAPNEEGETIKSRLIDSRSHSECPILQDKPHEVSVKEIESISEEDIEFIPRAVSHINEAIKNRLTAKDYQPEQEADHYKLGMIYKELGLYEHAVEELQKTSNEQVKHSTDQLNVFKLSGFFFLTDGKPQFAVGGFTPSLVDKGQSEGAQFYYHLSKLYEILDKNQRSSKRSDNKEQAL